MPLHIGLVGRGRAVRRAWSIAGGTQPRAVDHQRARQWQLAAGGFHPGRLHGEAAGQGAAEFGGHGLAEHHQREFALRVRPGRIVTAFVRGHVGFGNAERVGVAKFEEQVRDLAMPVEFSLENMTYFIDWTKNIPFQVERGEGECAV